MKWVFLLIGIIITAFSIEVRAGDLALSNEPENNGFTYQWNGYNLSSNNYQSSVVSVQDTMPAKENHGLKGKIIRLDRKYNRYLSGDKNKFQGHLSLLEMGLNSFARTDYSGYSVPGFMELNQSKSFEVNLRLFRYSAGLQKFKNNIGLVSGLELNLDDYRFSKSYTIVNDEGHTNPMQLNEEGLSKTKLSTTFLTVPLMIEFQMPEKGLNRIFVSGGIIGGFRISSHTKVKYFSQITKDHSDFNLKSFRYGVTFRVGYKDINIFATYYKTPFFKQGRGPEMFPFTVGIGLINK